MINTEIIEHAIRLGIYSSFIKRERGVSFIIVAPPEHGKTEIQKKFAFIESVRISTDFDSHKFTDMAMEYQAGKLKTIIIPDFLRIVKKKYSTQSNSLTIMNAITEEGWTGRLPLGQSINKPIHMNILTALTEDTLRDKRHKWTKMGFLSRFVPLSFSYFEKTKSQIMEYIKDRIYNVENPYDFEVPKNKIDVSLPKAMANQIQNISLDIMKDTNLLGFRLQKQLQTLSMANAVCNNRNLVISDDLDVIKEISKFINFSFNKI